MRVVLPSVAIVLALAANALAQPARTASPSRGAAVPDAPRFEDFPAAAGPPARNAPLVLTRRDRQYQTRLRAAAAEHADFAGHYVMATWGCGTECRYGAAANLRTGRVTFLPFATCCLGEAPDGAEDALAFRRDSSLLVLIGMKDEPGARAGAHYYRIQGDRLVHLQSVPFPQRR